MDFSLCERGFEEHREHMQSLDSPTNHIVELDDQWDSCIFNESFWPQIPDCWGETPLFSDIDLSLFIEEDYLLNTENELQHQRWQCGLMDECISSPTKPQKVWPDAVRIPSDILACHITQEGQSGTGLEGKNLCPPDEQAKIQNEEKRERSKMASARFRAKAKKRQELLKKLLDTERAHLNRLESQKNELQMENKRLKEQLVINTKPKKQEDYIKGILYKKRNSKAKEQPTSID